MNRALRPTIVVDVPKVRASLAGEALLTLTPCVMFIIVAGAVLVDTTFFWYLLLTLTVPFCWLYSRRKLKQTIGRYERNRGALPEHQFGRVVYRAPPDAGSDPKGPLVTFVGFFSESDLDADTLWEGRSPDGTHPFEGEMFAPAVRWCAWLLWLAAGMFAASTLVLTFLPPSPSYKTIGAEVLRLASYVSAAVAGGMWLYSRFIRPTELWLYPGRIVVRRGWCWEGREGFSIADVPMRPNLQIAFFDERPPWREAVVLLHDLRTFLWVGDAESECAGRPTVASRSIGGSGGSPVLSRDGSPVRAAFVIYTPRSMSPIGGNVLSVNRSECLLHIPICRRDAPRLRQALCRTITTCPLEGAAEGLGPDTR